MCISARAGVRFARRSSSATRRWQAARQSDLPQSVIKIINEAKRYAEGTAVRIEIKKAKDIETVTKLAGIKLAH